MTRNSIARIALSVLAVGVGCLLLVSVSRHKAKLLRIRKLPEVRALNIYGEEVVSTEMLDPSKRTVLMFFHPECEYCRKELEGILSRHQECRKVQWLFLTLAPSTVVEEYLMEYPLESIPGAYVLREDWPVTYKLFDVKGPPSLFIYDENGNLMKRFKGATSINAIVEELR